VVRLNTEDFLTNVVLFFDNNDFFISLKDSGREFHVSDIGCVWYRRPEDPIFPSSYKLESQRYITEQVRSILDGLYYMASDAFWINPRNTVRMSRSKLDQLRIAQKCGFRVPRTLITNEANQALQFFQEVQDVCIKSVYGPEIIYQEEYYPFFTIKLTEEEKIENLSLVEKCPTLFQEFIQKQFDLRVVVIGDTFHAVEIHSQEDTRTKEDFRVISPDRMVHKVHNLSDSFKSQIKAFTEYYNLVYSAFDFVVTANNDYYFLENNPNGQWLWLVFLTETPISQSFFDLIVKQL
jgi:glutathione synthase/RimK-type ligase-like ATP-grasp enzyme